MTIFANFTYGTVATAPSPTTSGTSLTLTSGQGALFPTPPFNCTVWPANVQSLSTNAEIVTVTAISTDTLTIVRGQENTTPISIGIGYQFSATITAKFLNSLQIPLNIYSGNIWPVTKNTQMIYGYPIKVAAQGAIQIDAGAVLISDVGG